MSHDDMNNNIDDLSSDLAASFVIAPEDHFSTDAPHPRYGLVKPRQAVTGQNERRRQFLLRLRERRADFYALAHGIALGDSPHAQGTEDPRESAGDGRPECIIDAPEVNNTADTEGVRDAEAEADGDGDGGVRECKAGGGAEAEKVRDIGGEETEIEHTAPARVARQRGTKRRGDDDESVQPTSKWMCQDEVMAPSKQSQTHGYRERKYKDQLMVSEWMVEKPEDFATEWLMKTCPIGKRCMVVSSQGQTRAFCRNGYCIERFDSALPGGRSIGRGAQEYCILDCILDEQERTFHVLDVMCWKGQPLYDSDTEFRFFWIQIKLQETDGIGQFSRYNPYRFTAIPSAPCDGKAITALVTQVASARGKPKGVDGVLFYDKEVRYCAGRNPAVLWLKPEMLEDILYESATTPEPM
ncbi:hypothetical protein SARC_04411 [Sphaeroforma arctica JP610]|uniref:Snurportin-1 n=1 Tax=Sphaeroforma arctica JP610 TaxID=667725 RepID=A0A0L0G3C4_9EUKA|nr:hypothetical protein SARC_04411 [Sphaeroforma arctica JP610]KNC83341.1 hypothetical protein SARC_04411 [Sphaeroforma arctica JP610]|eukprot:XP_014157243.1 hypothetical protein SARC_04411 [Sphaeroforma arctica JP610]